VFISDYFFQSFVIFASEAYISEMVHLTVLHNFIRFLSLLAYITLSWKILPETNPQTMDTLKLTGQNPGWIFNSRLGHACICRTIVHITKQPNLKLKPWLNQL